MKASILLCLAAALVGAVRAECDACIHEQCYRKHRLQGDKGTLMDIDRNTNTLYGINETGYLFRLCISENATCPDIADIPNIWYLTVDQRTGDCYGIQIINRIYKLDLFHSEHKCLVFGRSLWYLMFKDKLYYSGREGGIYTIEDGKSRMLVGTGKYRIRRFVIDRNSDIYFNEYTSNPPVIRRLSKGVINTSEYWYTYYILTVDKDGNAMFLHTETQAIYRVSNGLLTEVGALTGTLEYDHSSPILFDDENNIIYTSKDYYESYHLKKAKHVRCVASNTGYFRSITEVTTENSLSDGSKDNDDMSANTTAPVSTANSLADESDARSSGAPGQRSHQPDNNYTVEGVVG